MIVKLLKVLLIGVLVFGVAGCYGKEERISAPPPAAVVEDTVAILPYGAHDAFWEQFHQGAKEAAKAAGYRVRWESPPPVWNPKTQTEMMHNIINLHPPGIVLGPMHRNLLQSALVEAVKLNIPVIIAASNEDTSYQMTYVGSDNAAVGVDLAKAVGKLTPPNSKVVVINTQPGMRSVDLRGHSLQETLSQSFPNLAVSQTQFPDDGDLNFEESNLRSKIRQSLLEYLRTQTGVKSVVALDENSTQVAWQVLETIPKDSRPLLFGVTVNAHLISACRHGRIAALVVQDARRIGSESVRAISEYKNGKRPPQEVLIPYKVVSAGS